MEPINVEELKQRAVDAQLRQIVMEFLDWLRNEHEECNRNFAICVNTEEMGWVKQLNTSVERMVEHWIVNRKEKQARDMANYLMLRHQLGLKDGVGPWTYKPTPDPNVRYSSSCDVTERPEPVKEEPKRRPGWLPGDD